VTDAPSLSVIIVSYNTRDDLRRCLTALRQSTIRAEVIVVDNASSDGSAEMVRHEFPEVKLLESERNLYFCAGNNRGLDRATGEYALLLNPDTVPPPNALESLVSFMNANPDYAGATMQLRYPDGSIQRTCSRIPTYSYLLLLLTPLQWLFRRRAQTLKTRHWYDDWDRTTERDVEVVPGSCTFMHRADLRLNDNLLLYFNEDDLAQRFRGRKFRYLVDAPIVHREKSVARGKTATAIYFRDMITYTRAYHGAARAALLWALSRPLLWGMMVSDRIRKTG
jgi:hypothetical protein